MSLDTLIREAKKLPREQQSELLDALLHLVHSQSPTLTAAQESDLVARIAEADANPTASRPWSEVRERLRSKHLNVSTNANSES